jgi:hypothetical protein
MSQQVSILDVHMMQILEAIVLGGTPRAATQLIFTIIVTGERNAAFVLTPPNVLEQEPRHFAQAIVGPTGARVDTSAAADIQRQLTLANVHLAPVLEGSNK